MKLLLLTPPMTQLNTPYPATAYLTGFLRSRGYQATQADPALELVLRLLSCAGLARIQAALQKTKKAQAFLKVFDRYLETVEPVIGFLQGKNPTLALRIVSREFLPEGPRFAVLDELSALGDEQLGWAFGALGTQDRAKFLASLYVDDLSDVIREWIDPRFELSKYGEKLAASAPSFDPLERALKAKPTLVDQILDEITTELIAREKPDLICLSVPFPGNVYGALRIAQAARKARPKVKIAMGGGYVNTELRELTEPRVFDYVDFVTLDDGERPILALIEHLQGKTSQDELCRTFLKRGKKVEWVSAPHHHDIPQKDIGTPTYDGLKLEEYLSLFEMLNPMHRIWSDGRWNKLTLAHGCYWKKCSFCDVTLDYIGRYEANPASKIVDRMEALINETGQSGFHFVDEAAPPALLKAMAIELIERKLSITWWGNVRFEKSFTPELSQLLARSGCVAMSGGLEVASDRLLKLMNKGVSVDQVERVTRALTDSGIMVHAYLMYGFPTQTEAETFEALENVRRLFEGGNIQSGFWHRFSVTAHSPVGKNPEKFGIKLKRVPQSKFAKNDLEFTDPTGTDHDRLGIGLRKALYNYMLGLGFEKPVRDWFVD